MLFKNITASKLILCFITLSIFAMGVVILVTPPAIFPDPSWGFQVMRSMQHGAAFNMLVSPSPADLSKDLPSFLSWWSPGQYLVPYLFKSLLPINLGQAAALTVILGSLSGLAGYYFFFRKIGFSQLISALSILFIFCQQAIWIPFVYYPGGEILLFAFGGWFLYGCAAIRKPGWKLVLFVLCAGITGFVCKSSFMWIYASGMLCLWIRLSQQEVDVWGWIKKGFWLGIPAVASLATIYLFYLSKGENPASASSGFKLTFEAFGFPLASPLLAGFSIDDMINGLIFHTDGKPFSYAVIVIVLLALSALSIALIAAILRKIANRDYQIFIAVFYGMAILFFGYSFLKQATISYEARHFRILGLLIVPGLIYLASVARLHYKVIFGLIWLCVAFSGLKYVSLIQKSNATGARGTTGLSQPFIDQPSLDYLLALDKKTNNTIFAFISPDIGLEIQHNRIITVNEYDEDSADDLVPYKGYAGTIYLLLPAHYTNAQTAIMLKYFPDYKNFTVTQLSKNYKLYTAQ